MLARFTEHCVLARWHMTLNKIWIRFYSKKAKKKLADLEIAK